MMNNNFCNFLKQRKPKYVHFFRYSGIFSNNFFKFVCENSNIFDVNNTVFVCSSSVDERDYPSLTIFSCENLEREESDYINFAANYVENIFVHYMDIWTIMRLSQESRKKIIWRTWGNDLYKPISYSPSFRLKIKHLVERFFWLIRGKKIVNEFKYIGISSSECDLLILKKMRIFTNIQVLPYPNTSSLSTIPHEEHAKNGKLTVMVGHSSNSSLKHKKWIRKFSKHSDNFKLFVPLVYGRNDYKKKIVHLLNSFKSLDSEILDFEMPVDQYQKKLSNVDIAIFDTTNQMGLGNIIILLGLGKTIYLNKKSVVFKTLIEKGIPVYSTDELRSIKMSSIKNRLLEDKTKGMQYAENFCNKEFVKIKWSDMLNRL